MSLASFDFSYNLLPTYYDNTIKRINNIKKFVNKYFEFIYYKYLSFC
jgi:hypothetical protein